MDNSRHRAPFGDKLKAQKMASKDESALEVSENMRLLKLEALEKGDLTDVSFLVGPEDEAELVHCFKSDLLVSSEYFRALFRSPLTGPSPIKMKHVQPHIFKLLMRNISTNTFEQDLKIEDAVDLAHAADEYLLDAIKSYYLQKIKKMANVRNVWIILNRSITPQVKAVCNKVLTSRTKECLAHDSFLGATQESLLYLLKLNNLNIGEAVLVNACLKFANHRPEPERAALMKAALPYLRLLTLKLVDIPPELLEYLSDSEKAHLLTMSLIGSSGAKTNVKVGNLCPSKQIRSGNPRSFGFSSDSSDEESD